MSGEEQEGLTTTYFDCCKPACGWKANAPKGVAPTCSRTDLTTIVDADATKSVCDGGEATTCKSQYPFIDPEDPNLIYATAACKTSEELPVMCGKCFEVRFQGKSKSGEPDGLEGKRVIVKVTNTGQPGEYQNGGQFDLLIPGGGEGLFHGCSAGIFPDFGGYTVDGTELPPILKNEEALHDKSKRGNSSIWGLEYGGVQSLEGCSGLPEPLQEGCRIKFDWGGGKLGAENLTWFKEVPCPPIVKEKMGF